MEAYMFFSPVITENDQLAHIVRLSESYRILHAAQQLIADEDNWTTGVYTLDSEGNPFGGEPSRWQNPQKFCARGAILWAMHLTDEYGEIDGCKQCDAPFSDFLLGYQKWISWRAYSISSIKGQHLDLENYGF